MKEKSESLSAADFFEKLQHDQLDKTVPFSITGMVKKSEGKEKTIEFAPGGKCSNWVSIPLEYIEDVEMIETIACKDHSHPLVKLKLKKPETPEGKLLFALLSSTNVTDTRKSANHESASFPFLNSHNNILQQEVMGMTASSARQLQPDGSIIYKKKCTTKYAWICDANGCRWFPYTECTIYPELGFL